LICSAENDTIKRDWYVPIVADAEAGFGGPLHAFELTKVQLHPTIFQQQKPASLLFILSFVLLIGIH
jgi:hypothetical protein